MKFKLISLKTVFVLSMIINCTLKLHAQTPVVNSIPPSSIDVCGAEQAFKISLKSLPLGNTNVSVNVNLNGLVYTSSSGVLINGQPLIQPTYNAASGILTFALGNNVPSTEIFLPFNAKATCNSTNNSISSQLVYNNGTTIIESTPNTFSINKPFLKLTPVLEGSMTSGTKNDIITRTTKLTNASLASNNFFIEVIYSDNTILDLNELRIKNSNSSANVALVVKSSSGILPIKSYVFEVTPAILTALDFTSGSFGTGELTIIEKAKVISCANNNQNVNTGFKVHWGCSDGANVTFCDASIASASAASSYVQNPGAYSLSLSSPSSALASYANGGNYIYKIHNNGQGELVNIFPVIEVSEDINVTALTADNGSGNYSLPVALNAPTVSNGIKKYTITNLVLFNSLLAGSSKNLKLEYGVSCKTDCGLKDRYIKTKIYYKKLCQVNEASFVDSIMSKDTELQQGPNSLSGPVDVVSGTDYTFSFKPQVSITSSGVMQACQTNAYKVRLTLPADLGLASISNATYNGVAITTSISGQVITFNGGGANGSYQINLRLNQDCATNPSNKFQSVNWELISSCSGNTGICERRLACESWEYFTHYSCATGTGGCAVGSSDFKVNRNTFGYANSANGVWNSSTIPTAFVNASTAGINLKAVYQCDNMKVNLTGSVPANCVISGSSIKARITYRFPAGIPRPINPLTTKVLEFVSATYSNVGASSTINGSLTLSSLTYNAVEDVLVADFVLPAANLLAGALNFQAIFKLNKEATLVDNAFIPRFRGEWIASTATSTYGSNTWGDLMTVYKPLTTVSHNETSAFPNLCAQKRQVVLNVDGGKGDDFPNEMRSVAKFDKITYNLPPNYQYVTGTSKIEANGSIISIGNPVVSGLVTTGFILTWNKENSWPIADKINTMSQIKLNFDLNPLCPGGGIFTGIVLVDDYDYSCVGIETFNLNSLTDPRRAPNLYFNNPSVFYGSSQTSEFLVDLIENNGVTASNVWVALESDPTVAITEVLVFNGSSYVAVTPTYYGSTPALKQKAYIPLGILSAAKKLKIRTTFSNCDSTAKKILMYANWDCNAYPPAITAAPATFNPVSIATCGNLVNGQLTYNQQIAEFNFNLIEPAASSSYRACEPVTFKTNLINIGNSTLYNLEYWMVLPTGISLGALTNIKYKINSGALTQLPLTGVANPATNRWPLSSVLPNGLSSGDTIYIEFPVSSTCDYFPLNPIQIFSQGKTPCGTLSALKNATRKVPLVGLEAVDNVFLQMSSPNITVVGGETEVVLTINNTAGAILTGIDLSLIINGGVSFQGITLTSPANPAPAISGTNQILLNWKTATSNSLTLNPGVNYIKFKLKDVTTSNLCTAIDLTAAIKVDKFVDCASGTRCNYNLEITSARSSFTVPTVSGENGNYITCADCIGSFAPIEGKKYIVSAWVKEDNNLGLINYVNTYLQLNFEAVNLTSPAFYPSGNIIDGWQRIYGEFTVPVGTYAVNLILKNTGPTNNAYFDDIRIHPIDGNLKSFVYDAVSLKLVAELDENNYSTFYEYDEEGTLVRVKKETERGIMTIKESRNHNKK